MSRSTTSTNSTLYENRSVIIFPYSTPPEHLYTSAPLSLSASTTACFQFPAALLLSSRSPALTTPETHREVMG